MSLIIWCVCACARVLVQNYLIDSQCVRAVRRDAHAQRDAGTMQHANTHASKSKIHVTCPSDLKRIIIIAPYGIRQVKL